MDDKFKAIKGIRIAEKKYGLIWLKDQKNKTSQTLDYFKFKALLFQSFDEDNVKKIEEAINCEKKLLIDFDNSKVKIITLKDEPFTDCMKRFFTPAAAAEELNYIEENTPESKFYNF